MNRRVEVIKIELAKRNIEGMIINNPKNVSFIIGFDVEGTFLICQNANYLIIDQKYLEEVNSKILIDDEITILEQETLTENDYLEFFNGCLFFQKLISDRIILDNSLNFQDVFNFIWMLFRLICKKVYIFLRLINIKGDIMANLDKATEEKILEIVEKYQKEDTKLLNYLITDDVITFFSPLANGNAITAEDLQKVANILDGSFEGMEIVNQEYRFKFKCGL